MEMSSKTKRKIVVKRTLILKAKAQRLQWKMWKALCSPSVNTAIPHYNQFEIKVLILIFHLKTKVLSTVSFTSAGYMPSGLFLK
jgi:hypothetical protein